MNCIECQHPNPATVQYCQQCGARLNLTADEIHESLVQKESQARADKTVLDARRLLVFGVILFVASVTLFFAAGKADEGATHLPSAAESAKYAEFDYKYVPDVSKALVPISVKRKP